MFMSFKESNNVRVKRNKETPKSIPFQISYNIIPGTSPFKVQQ